MRCVSRSLVFAAKCVCLGVFAALPMGAEQPAYVARSGRTLIRTAAVVDVRTGREMPLATVIVQGERIVGVAPTAGTPVVAGDREIDLHELTVMPGLMDVHTHLTGVTDFDPYAELSLTPGQEAIHGVENAKTTLEAGFTTVRNVGGGRVYGRGIAG